MACVCWMFDDVCGFSRFMQHPQAFPRILTIKSISLIKSKPQLLQKTPSKSPLVLCTRFGSCLAIMELHSIGRPFMDEFSFYRGALCALVGPQVLICFNFIENKWPVLSKRFEFIEVHWHPRVCVIHFIVINWAPSPPT